MNSCPEWLSTMQGPLVIETTCLAPLVIRAHLSFKQPAFLSCCKLKNSKSGHWPPTLPRAGALAGPIAGDPSLLPRGDSTPHPRPLPDNQPAVHPSCRAPLVGPRRPQGWLAGRATKVVPRQAPLVGPRRPPLPASLEWWLVGHQAAGSPGNLLEACWPPPAAAPASRGARR